MQYIERLIKDLFAMEFDIVIPLSGSIVAVIVAIIIFLWRYIAYRKNCKKFADEKPMELPYKRKNNKLEYKYIDDDNKKAESNEVSYKEENSKEV